VAPMLLAFLPILKGQQTALTATLCDRTMRTDRFEPIAHTLQFCIEFCIDVVRSTLSDGLARTSEGTMW